MKIKDPELNLPCTDIKLTQINDIVPYLLEHAKTIPLIFEGKHPDFWFHVGSYEFNDGYETWFPFWVPDAVDFEAAMQAHYITYLEMDTFYGSYWSGEIHRYKLLWVEDLGFVAINFMVGDTTSSRTLWFKDITTRSNLISELMKRFPITQSDVDECEAYTATTGAEITSSRYLGFAHDGTSIWALNKSPNHGSLLGEREMRLVKHQEGEVYSDYGVCPRHIDHKAISYRIHRIDDVELKVDDGTSKYTRIEKVLDTPFIAEVANAK